MYLNPIKKALLHYNNLCGEVEPSNLVYYDKLVKLLEHRLYWYKEYIAKCRLHYNIPTPE